MTPTVKTFNTGFVEAIEQAYPIEVLETLLRDRTTGKNIVWADNEYEELGEGYLGADEITLEKITGTNSGVIKPRIAKEHERQSLRTKSRAEVFTPSWLCNQMNNHFDEEWFGRSDVFNTQEDREWTPTKSVTSFPRRKGFSWKDYVCALRLEITCGEAPFICSRYDTVSGEPLPVKARIGFLDRKLRVVTEKSKSYEDWYEWALRALQSTYGYEYQGDNLIIARINVLETFFEHMVDRWDKGPTNEESACVAEIISWNIWQMDGLTGTVPSDKPVDIEQARVFELNEPPVEQMTLFEFDDPDPPAETAEFCQIFDWEENEPLTYISLKSEGAVAVKKFYAVIGNPPYQEEQNGDNSTYAPPIYNAFLDESFSIAERVELIHPARFLFNSGSTPKDWNEKMLADPHFKVLDYEIDSSKYFSGVSIMGGVAISYRNDLIDYGPMKIFLPFEELHSILDKVVAYRGYQSITEVIYIQSRFKLDALYIDHPDARKMLGSNGKDSRFEKNIFTKIPIFTAKPRSNDDVRVLGILDRKRSWQYVPRKYVDDMQGNLDSYKVIMSVSNGAAGSLGDEPARIAGMPEIGKPNEGYTRSFISIGSFSSYDEVFACSKYIQTKFARVLLGTLKMTQMLNKDVWQNVPLQDFTSTSDIDWSQSIAGIDQQLYKKYGLSQEEIAFIESHVKEMS